MTHICDVSSRLIKRVGDGLVLSDMRPLPDSLLKDLCHNVSSLGHKELTKSSIESCTISICRCVTSVMLPEVVCHPMHTRWWWSTTCNSASLQLSLYYRRWGGSTMQSRYCSLALSHWNVFLINGTHHLAAIVGATIPVPFNVVRSHKKKKRKKHFKSATHLKLGTNLQLSCSDLTLNI